MLPTVTLTWFANKYKVHKLHQNYILRYLWVFLFLFFWYIFFQDSSRRTHWSEPRFRVGRPGIRPLVTWSWLPCWKWSWSPFMWHRGKAVLLNKVWVTTEIKLIEWDLSYHRDKTLNEVWVTTEIKLFEWGLNYHRDKTVWIDWMRSELPQRSNWLNEVWDTTEVKPFDWIRSEIPHR